MVRMGRYKLVYDMLGNGELYDLEKDPSELRLAEIWKNQGVPS